MTARPQRRAHRRDQILRHTPETSSTASQDVAPETSADQPLITRRIPNPRASGSQRAPRRRRLRAGFTCRRPPATARGRKRREGRGEAIGLEPPVGVGPGRERHGGQMRSGFVIKRSFI
ncbi:hypothetical protein ZWY2020_009264 [Hordeum vulgare]|nr:hypothetical protein ZWY2020_009264 [Hordeum vulgare]